ncbi:uncharacterized protein LOC141640658 [Silene latifolia]|uniref:uncharacterized protein LOC141640658 n=1 Tax=Silene latifolia TaxID=37657 RepID=UPI003D77FB91
MHAQPQPLELDQRKQIFRTRCTIKERVYNLIIDGGCSINVASKTLIEKLSLPTQDDPQPYKLRWLNKGAEVRVDKQCLVPFSIGKDYSDEVMCNVLPMDACHLLLGRPWEFDRDCVHQGREKTYSFKLGKKKITLTPLLSALKYTTPPSLVKPSKEVLIIGETDMVQELNSREIVLILLAKGITEEAGLPLPAQIQHLLKAYGDVFPEELPSGLPPLRGIKHHIDLIP